jgi:CRP/FNR family transcriptional regulator
MTAPVKPFPKSDEPSSGSASRRVAAGGLAPVISIRDLKVHCSTCSMRELCLPVGIDSDDMKQIDVLLGNRVKLHKGDSLYRAGEPFAALFAIRIGSLKTTVLAEDGR